MAMQTHVVVFIVVVVTGLHNTQYVEEDKQEKHTLTS